MLQNLSGWHAVIILAIVLLVFGTAKLPMLAKSVGESLRILKAEVVERDEPREAKSTDAPAMAAVEPPKATVAEQNSGAFERATA